MALMRAGIIGCGMIAQRRHIPEYMANPDAEIAGYYDINPERSRQMAEKYGGKAYESLEKMLEDTTVDAVSVCVINTLHAPVAIQALKAGKNVLCEKPMAATIEECQEMVEAADEAGKILMIGQNQRLTAGHQKARELIQQGAIGKVLTFRTMFGHQGPENWLGYKGTNCWFFDKVRSAMGVIADLGVHKTDVIQFILNDYVEEVTSRLATLDKRDSKGQPIAVDDNAFCIYKMKSGAIGTMTASWTDYGSAEDNSTVIYGTEGVLHVYDNPDHTLYIDRVNGERIWYDLDKIQTNELQFNSHVIDEFVSAVTEGRETCISGRDVMQAMKAVFAAVSSSQEGRTVHID